MRILYVVNSLDFFVSHRLGIAKAALYQGFDVHLAAAAGADAHAIEMLGIRYHPIPLTRSGKNLLQELKTLWKLWRLFRSLKPDLVHLVTIKPVLYGGIMARFAKVPGVVAAISGLGSVFHPTSVHGRILKGLVKRFYRFAFAHANMHAIFQNPEDQAVILSLNAIEDSRTTIIPGSGVELEAYPHVAEPEAQPVAIFAARLLRDKGVFEFVEAAAILRSRGVDARFLLVGSPDSGNPASVTADQLERFKREGVVEVMGFRQDIAQLFSNSNIVVLPSYYGEGLPKVLIEAAACGRAVVTTDHPGCRDAIEPGRSGILVPVRDARALADALQMLIGDASLRHQYGMAGRDLAERLFSVHSVIDAHLNIYRQLLEAKQREQ